MSIIFFPSYCNFLFLEEYVSYNEYTLHYTETDGTRIETSYIPFNITLTFPPKIQVLAFQNISAKLEELRIHSST